MIGQPWDTLLLLAIAAIMFAWSKQYGWEDILRPYDDEERNDDA